MLLRRLGMMPFFGLLNAFVALRPLRSPRPFVPLGTIGTFSRLTAFNLLAAFGLLSMLRMFHVLGVFAGFGMPLVRVLHGFRRGVARRFLVFGFRRRGSITGRGQGTARFAAAGMASASASGATPATRRRRIRLLG